MQLRLNRNEVARLFYLTNGDRGLPELLEIFSTFKAREIVGLPTKQAETPVVQESTIEEAAVGTVAQATAFNPVFLKKVDQLEFSVRTSMCLKNENIVYIGDLVKETEASMLRVPNLGRKSLNEIKEALVQLDLHLGIEIPGWPPENVAELAERFRND
jgi:DNA-directed RNA polymerase alpha subunit